MPATWIPYFGDTATTRYWVGHDVPQDFGRTPWSVLPIGGAIITDDRYTALTRRPSIYQHGRSAKKRFMCRDDGVTLLVVRTA